MATTTTKELIKQGKLEFQRVFGYEPKLFSVAPGRVNLIGGHVDYCQGFAMPMALNMKTVIVGSPSVQNADKDGDQICRVASLAFPCDDQEKKYIRINKASLTEYADYPEWTKYVIGVLALFPTKTADEIPQFDAVVVSNVPIGGGVSSSAALEVSIFAFLQNLTGKSDEISGKERALVCQKVEQRYAGLPCGIMDQFISSLAVENHATLIDCRSLESINVPIDAEQLSVVVTNSHVKHKLTGSEYPERQRMTAEAAKLLGKNSLRDATMDDLNAKKCDLSEVIYRRARHVIQEIERTQRAKAAFIESDFVTAGQLMNESHNSLRDDFEVSCAELDELVTIARGVSGVFGSRMTGGGFGGCTVTICEPKAADSLVQEIKVTRFVLSCKTRGGLPGSDAPATRTSPKLFVWLDKSGSSSWGRGGGATDVERSFSNLKNVLSIQRD